MKLLRMIKAPGINRGKTTVALVLLAALAAVLLFPRQPDSPLKLTLELARPRWYTGQSLWYRLSIQNVGRKTITIRDFFWRAQGAYADNVRGQFGTFFVITDPEGQVVHYDRWLARGIFHGERSRLWNNDCGGGKACQDSKEDLWRPVKLKAGQSFTATPSIVAPVRELREGENPFLADPRALPWAPKGLTQEQLAARKARWRKTVEDLYLWGDVGYRPDPKAPPEPLPAGFRITEGYSLDKPGRYKIQAVYAPFGLKGTPDDYRSIAPGASDQTWDWKSRAKIFVYRSNVVEFDVVDSPASLLPKGFNDWSRERQKKWALDLEKGAGKEEPIVPRGRKSLP